jgi:hypothetical protein
MHFGRAERPSLCKLSHMHQAPRTYPQALALIARAGISETDPRTRTANSSGPPSWPNFPILQKNVLQRVFWAANFVVPGQVPIEVTGSLETRK